MSPSLPSLTKSQRIVVSVLAIALAGGIGAAIALRLPTDAPATEPGQAVLSPQQIHDVATAAFRKSMVRSDGARATRVTVRVRPGDTLPGAIQRAGVSPEEAKAAVQSLSPAMDVLHIKAGLDLAVDVARPAGAGIGKLAGLALRTGPTRVISLSRDVAGGFHLRDFQEKVSSETTVATGPISGSLYLAALRAGADARLVAEATKLFSHKIDFSRDLHPDDHFKLVFDRKVTENGRTVETGGLMFAEMESKGQTTRFYRFRHDGKEDFFDDAGKNIKGFLLRTPVDAVRITSSFGMRFHPILGYNRMHQGIDFGASTGTPVYAAGDGVVKEIKWAGGYGHWLKIGHNAGWATGYGHLSAYARGLRVGQKVHQGQVVAYVGSTGASTGPHLHYEVMSGTQKLDPKSARVPQGTVLGGRELAAFRSEKAHIESLITQAARRAAGSVQTAQAGIANHGGAGGGI